MSVRGAGLEQASSVGAPAARLWQFGHVVLDERSLELRVASNPVDLDRKAIEVLRHLLHHAGEVVTKDELLAAVWPGRILSDSALTSCVARLREALQDHAQEIIKTVHGYGYRLIAQVRVIQQHVAPAARFDFKPGDHPPGRPLWNLIRRLGAGGHGEAWLGQHDKTREQRVFKFANDETTLGALKREITLFRLLNDSLGERARIVELLDWNLELQPYFVESRYIAGGSLTDWAERHGKLSAVPLGTRLDVAAQIADALAAVHSVGVLHKDLKPSNVLIEEVAGAAPRVRLADFGSGGILDPERLEQLGITHIGFTRTLKAGEVEGTLLYLAPEVAAGQIPTVKADIYALGVVLYQLVLGDFRAAMSPGWERDIEDELLRECIADAAQGEPERRLSDADALATRLRTLEQAREQRRKEHEAKARAEAAARALERLRARRVGLIVAAVAMVAGTVTSTALYLDARRARDEATSAAAVSQAVADFLSKDMFAAVSSKPLRALTIPELLEAAALVLPERMRQQPAAAAQVHAALGRAFLTMEMLEAAEKHLDPALAAYEAAGPAALPDALTTATQVVHVKFVLGKLPALSQYERLVERGRRELGRSHPAVLALMNYLANAEGARGEWLKATASLQRLIADARTAPEPDVQLLGSALNVLGGTRTDLGEFNAAEQTLREARALLGGREGPAEQLLGLTHLLLGDVLIEMERFTEAEGELAQAITILNRWAADGTNSAAIHVQAKTGMLRLRQGRTDEAIAVLTGALASGKSGIEKDRNYRIRYWLALAYRDAGRLAEARATVQAARKGAEALLGPNHPFTQGIYVLHAEILCLQREWQGARQVLSAVDERGFLVFGAAHPQLGELRRIEGVLALADHRLLDARQALEQALGIFEKAYGPQHRFTQRARLELAGLTALP